MPASFPRPTFQFDYSIDSEIRRVREHKATRGIPRNRVGAGGGVVVVGNAAQARSLGRAQSPGVAGLDFFCAGLAALRSCPAQRPLTW